MSGCGSSTHPHAVPPVHPARTAADKALSLVSAAGSSSTDVANKDEQASDNAVKEGECDPMRRSRTRCRSAPGNAVRPVPATLQAVLALDD